MLDLFDRDKANLTGLASGKQIFVSDIKHVVRIKVGLKGILNAQYVLNKEKKKKKTSIFLW